MECEFPDIIDARNNKDIKKIIGDEEICYSNRIFKSGSLSKGQDYFFILTISNIYIISKKSLKKRIPLSQIKAITFSSNSHEIIIHLIEDDDLLYASSDKHSIIYAIIVVYEKNEKNNNKNISLYLVADKSLKAYIESKKDKKKEKNSKLKDCNLFDVQTFLIDYSPKEKNRESNDSEEGKKTDSCEWIFSKDEKNFPDIKNQDFNILNVLGQGNTGKLYYAENKRNKKYYVLKSLKKELLDLTKKEYMDKLKKDVCHLSFKFLIDVEFCFETSDRIYFAFPYIKGEVLFKSIKVNKGFNEEQIKFYAGIIILTLEYLHEKEINYRALNTKSIIIDEDGYLKIIPFRTGMILKVKDDSKILEDYINEYSPPEVYEKREMKESDMWNLGIIIYEMIYGIPPFYSNNFKELQNMVLNDNIKFIKQPLISNELKNLITQLLKKNPSERLTLDKIKEHQFFKNLNFDDLYDKKIAASYKPNIESNNNKEKIMNNIFSLEDFKEIGIFK